MPTTKRKNKNKVKSPKPLFHKILIANRGEIACRIIRTCHVMGIRTVAVYSEADALALHVLQAGEAVLIGPSPPEKSYLNIEAIIRAAQETEAQAIHPGYGFLAENPTFVEACQKASITFIGPSAEAMRKMKNKAQARHLAEEAGLPVLPGTEGEVTNEGALEQASQIGFPLMVKATRGGGGIGIRLVQSLEQLPEALKRSRSLAHNAFGSSGIYLEKHVDEPSHIEVNILADHYGNAVHLFERDCSVQRRNQKVVEETPCVKLKKRRLNSMYQAALDLVHHIGYTGVGTVEFLVDRDGHFYFMEMNARLQVEHPITEFVTGLDIVEQQIRIAAGETLGFLQKNIRRRGHAIEARIYPEDPTTFMPISGRVEEVIEPQDENLRVDSALYPGYEVTPYYDSLMAKVIAWGKSRKRAITTLAKGLQDFQIRGITHNIPLIQRVLADEEFKDGEYSTQLLTRLSGQANGMLSLEEQRNTVAAVAAALGELFGNGQARRPSPWKTYGRATQMISRPRQGGGHR